MSPFSTVMQVIQDYLILGSRITVTNIWLRINDLSSLGASALVCTEGSKVSVFFNCTKFRFKTLPQILRYFEEKRFQAEGT